MDHDISLSLHLFLSLATLAKCFPSLTLNLSIIQSIIFNLCLPLALFPVISASKIFFSIPPSLLNLCPTDLHCLVLIVVKSYISDPAFSNTTSLVSFSVHDILIIFLQNYISITLSFCSIFLFIIHDSHPYNSTDQI